MPIFPGLGKAATYVGRALGGTLESNMARVAAKAETKVGRKYLSRLDRAGQRSRTIQRGVNDPIPQSETARIQREARQSVARRARAGEDVGRSGTIPFTKGTHDTAKRKEALLYEQGSRAATYQRQRTQARTMQLNRSVRRGSVGLAAGMAMSGKGPNESRTSYRGPGPTPGLRKPMGTGRFAG
jgi:hypothetical protein